MTATATMDWCPPAPRPRRSPLGRVGMILGLRRNPIETWGERHFEEPIVPMDTVLGHVVAMHAPAGIRQVLVEDWDAFPKDRLQRRVLQPGLGGGLLTAEGDAWKRTRRVLAPLFTPKAVDQYTRAMSEVAQAFVDRLVRREGRVVEIGEEMRRVTFLVLARTLFSTGLTTDPDAFGAALGRYFDTMGRVDPLDIFDAPDWVPRLGRIAARPAIRFFEETVDAMVAARKSLIANDPSAAPNDLMTALLTASDPETGAGLTLDEVRANIVTFIGAGHETTANALTWALYLLSQAPDVAERLRAEADGADPMAGLEAMPFTRAVLEEAMRLYPPVTFLGRQASATTVIEGVPVPKGAMVVTSLWVLHRHRRLWDAPDAFRPERFLPGSREAIDRHAYMPFGAGPRVCIGARFALLEAVIVLAEIMRRTDPTFVGNEPPWPVQRVTLRPKSGLHMRVARRAA